MSNATMHANRQRKCKQEIKKARHKMNGILYEFTENISCTPIVVEGGQNKAEKRATTLCSAYYLQHKTTLRLY